MLNVFWFLLGIVELCIIDELKKLGDEKMNRISVKSSNIKSIGYDETSNTLEIEFNDGHIYQYIKVPINIYNELMKSESQGKFFHATIRNNFAYKKIS